MTEEKKGPESSGSSAESINLKRKSISSKGSDNDSPSLKRKSNSKESDDESWQVEFKGDENQQRGNWSGRFDFLLSCIGYAVGLGNIWRFPYLCYSNGGGAFLIPYICFLFLCGLPLVFLEMSFGQFSSLSPIAIWKICPLFKGLGYGMVIISAIVCVYYNIIIAWTLFYLLKSFTVPWSSCGNSWNTAQCIEMANASDISLAGNSSQRRITPSEEFWKFRVLEITEGIHDLGGIRWELFVALLIAWVIVFLCLSRGIKSSGRVVYVTAVFPYIILVILCIRGVTLPGAVNGIKLYLLPQWHKLGHLKVWIEAAMQIFYSVGASWGAIITMSSYNKFHNNCYRNAMFVPLLNCCTSVFAGFVIFSIIGFIQHSTGAPIENVVDSGPGLIFVVYPEALAELIMSPFWSVLFFLMIFTVGLDSQFGMFETVISAFIDEFPEKMKSKKLLITICLVLVEFALGILCVTRGGMYVLHVIDWYSSTFSLMVISFFECVVISWIYGADRFYNDIEFMIGYRPHIWWRTCWKYVTPTVIMIAFLSSLIEHEPVTYGKGKDKYEYPGWAVVIGMCLMMLSLIPMPILGSIALYKENSASSLLERLKLSLRPRDDWGPMVKSFNSEWRQKNQELERQRQLRQKLSQVEKFKLFCISCFSCCPFAPPAAKGCNPRAEVGKTPYSDSAGNKQEDVEAAMGRMLPASPLQVPPSSGASKRKSSSAAANQSDAANASDTTAAGAADPLFASKVTVESGVDSM